MQAYNKDRQMASCWQRTTWSMQQRAPGDQSLHSLLRTSTLSWTPWLLVRPSLATAPMDISQWNLLYLWRSKSSNPDALRCRAGLRNWNSSYTSMEWRFHPTTPHQKCLTLIKWTIKSNSFHSCRNFWHFFSPTLVLSKTPVHKIGIAQMAKFLEGLP